MATPHPRANILRALADGRKVRVRTIVSGIPSCWCPFIDTKHGSALLTENPYHEFEIVSEPRERFAVFAEGREKEYFCKTANNAKEFVKMNYDAKCKIVLFREVME